MKIVILEDYALTPGDLDWSPLYELDAEIERYRRTTQEQAPGRIADAEYVIVNKVCASWRSGSECAGVFDAKRCADDMGFAAGALPMCRAL